MQQPCPQCILSILNGGMEKTLVNSRSQTQREGVLHVVDYMGSLPSKGA